MTENPLIHRGWCVNPDDYYRHDAGSFELYRCRSCRAEIVVYLDWPGDDDE